jgi:hypothetical protein
MYLWQCCRASEPDWVGGMATSVSVQASGLAVDPGHSVSTELRVRNTGDVVDQVAFQPLGEAAPWISVDPPVVRLFPDTDQIVTVTIAPPREPTSKPGVATWAVKAIPQEDPAGAAVGEGTVHVGEFVEISAELQPVNGRGRLAGKFDIAVDNRGNVPVPVRLAASDTEQVLGFDFDPVALETAPGSAHFSKLSIKPPKRIWKGTPKTYPFQLLVEPQVRAIGVTGDSGAPLPAPSGADGTLPVGVALAAPALVPPATPIVLSGNFVQEAVIPKWLWKALLALLALAIALWVMWKTLLEPQVESAARAVAIEEVAEVAEDVETLSSEVEQAEQQAAAAQETADEAVAAAGEEGGEEGGGGGGGAPPTTAPGGGGGEAPPATTVPSVPTATTVPANQTGGPAIGADAVPTNFRLVAAAEAGSNASSTTGNNPEGTTTAITDIILQNPSGDIGFIRVIINGQVIIEAALESFSTQDFHYVAPYVVQPGQAAGIEVSCAPDQIVASDPCSPAVSFAGYTTTAAPAGG